MAISAQTIILEALADLGTIRPGDVPPPLVMTDMLLRLNQRMYAHSIEGMLAQTQQHDIYNLQSGVSHYQLGVGGSFATNTRPEKVTGWRAFYGPFFSGGKILTFDELQQASKGDGLGSLSSIPSAVGADVAFPLINIGVFPAPNALPGQLELSFYGALSQFNDLTSSYTFPDGWDDFLHYDLAFAVISRYGRQGFDPATLIQNAASAKGKILALNAPTAPQGAQQ